MDNKIHYEAEFHQSYKTGDKIKVTRTKYESTGVWANVQQVYITTFYTIRKTDLNDCHGQVQLTHGKGITIVEYQWFNEELTGRKITKV